MYEIATSDVREMAQSIIRTHHRHLTEARIQYIFREKAWKTSCNKTILGRAARRNELDKLLSQGHDDFLIILAKPQWERSSEDEKRMLLDHELSHCGVVINNIGRVKWIIRKHDVEEFFSILARYDFVRNTLSNFINNPPRDETSERTLRRITPDGEVQADPVADEHGE